MPISWEPDQGPMLVVVNGVPTLYEKRAWSYRIPLREGDTEQMYQIMIEATPESILSHSRMMELGQAFNDMFGLGEYDIEECIVEGDPEEFMVAKGYKIRKQEPRAKKKATVKKEKEQYIEWDGTIDPRVDDDTDWSEVSEDEETEVKEKKKRLEGGEEEEGRELDQERNVEVNSAATEQSLNRYDYSDLLSALSGASPSDAKTMLEERLYSKVMGLDISAHVAGVITRRMMVEFDSYYIAFMITVPNEIQLRKEIFITKSTVEQTTREEALSKREIELPINTRLTKFYPPQHENENQQPSEE
ncbi:unnamed protein product [Aureobasidium pullulans]|uniref:Uncharacterized protein n=1 Tax=Aureobasidium pullulans TaxID=5580 RepID=A0A4S8X850_AURPU|nr:hypothetical protein D6D22_08083 [Aureobasidium pullulans]THX40394.1 hypothetical protein D6D10_03512 [Aureobasidium pullulans]CAD0059033.1 unnamed protein product [Aureobasidium pullulans]